jgi:hypothetical protein
MKKSITVNTKKRGRPAGQEFPVSVQLRLDEVQAAAIDAWRRGQPDPPSRSGAIRALVQRALDAAPAAPLLDQQLARVEQKLARKIPAKPSPERGVALMRKGLAEVEHRKLSNKKRVAESGRKAASEPGEGAPVKESRGKKGRKVKDGSLTRRALAGIADQPKSRSRKP